MHRQFLLILGFFLPLVWASAQEKLEASYFSNVFIQPGISVGMELPLRSIGKDTSKARVLFVLPKVGLFAHPGVSRNMMISAAVGVWQQKADSKISQSLSLTVGYLNKSEIQSLRVRLSDGEITDRNREVSHFFIPTINYSIARQLNDRLDIFGRGSLGWMFSGQKEQSVMALAELGVQLSLAK